MPTEGPGRRTGRPGRNFLSRTERPAMLPDFRSPLLRSGCDGPHNSSAAVGARTTGAPRWVRSTSALAGRRERASRPPAPLRLSARSRMSDLLDVPVELFPASDYAGPDAGPAGRAQLHMAGLKARQAYAGQSTCRTPTRSRPVGDAGATWSGTLGYYAGDGRARRTATIETPEDMEGRKPRLCRSEFHLGLSRAAGQLALLGPINDAGTISAAPGSAAATRRR